MRLGSGVTLEGIDQAIEDLGYRSARSPKKRLLEAVRGLYKGPEDLDSMPAVAHEYLIRTLWGSEDGAGGLASRKRNLSSLRSSINSDLMRLYHEGKNPEGVILGPDYTFVLSDEAKDQTLELLGSMASPNSDPDPVRIQDVLRGIQKLLADMDPDKVEAGVMEALGAMVSDLAGSMGLDPGRRLGEGEGPQADIGVVEILEDSEDAEEEDFTDEEPEELDEDEVLEEEEPEEEPLSEEDPEEIDEDEVLEEVEVREGPWDEIEEIPEGLDEETDPEEIEEEIEEEESGETEAAEVLEEEEPEEEPLSEEDPEEIDEDEILEEVEGEGQEEASSLDGQILDIDGGGEVDMEKNRLLAEEFNQSLAAVDRFYNQHIWISGGEYKVGSPSPSTGERPEAAVLVEDFYIGKFPVTNALFELFVEKTGYRTTAEKAGYSIVHQGRFRRRIDERTGKKEIICRSGISSVRIEGACWYQPTGPGSSLRHKRNHPAVHISLEDAFAFAAWCGKRLPTEEEWEAAMRTGSGLKYPWGNEWTGSACNMEKAFVGDTSAVDRYIEYENPLGVADALGNVLEWTITMEKDGRVLKGGSWLSKDGTPLWYRKVLPAEPGSNITGFRCVAF